MPPLRQRLTRAAPYVLVLFACVLAVGVDIARAPQRQVLAGMYLRFVDAYQQYGRPLAEGYVACRYRPTCSDYSKQAVERFGLIKGIQLTVRRLASCRTGVPMGTPDPVPPAPESQAYRRAPNETLPSRR